MVTRPTNSAATVAPAPGATATPKQAPRYGFTGHQTFPFRSAWVPKGVAAVRDDAEIFSRPDALVRLGVGKNMVDAIRFWCGALGVLSAKGKKAEITQLGKFLFGGGRTDAAGADPYLEDPGTLWLLHWRLASRIFPASTWHLTFTRWRESTFSRAALVRWLVRTAGEAHSKGIAENTVRRDVDVFLQTYLPAPERRHRFGESMDCPLAELGLLRRVSAERFAFERAPRPSLPDEILAYALNDFWRGNARSQKSLALERVLFDAGSPGAAFKLSANALTEILRRLPARYGFRYDESAGQRMLFREKECSWQGILTDYYPEARR